MRFTGRTFAQAGLVWVGFIVTSLIFDLVSRGGIDWADAIVPSFLFAIFWLLVSAWTHGRQRA